MEINLLNGLSDDKPISLSINVDVIYYRCYGIANTSYLINQLVSNGFNIIESDFDYRKNKTTTVQVSLLSGDVYIVDNVVGPLTDNYLVTNLIANIPKYER